jgi:hypothetical protein
MFHVAKTKPLSFEKSPISNLENFCRIERIEGIALGDTGPPRKSKLWITSRLKSLDSLFIRKEEDGDISDIEIMERHGEEILLTGRGEEIGWVFFDEGVYCDSPHLQVPTFFLPVVKGTFEGPDWCQGLLLQSSSSVYYEFERVGVAQITVIEWLGDVEEQCVCIF